MNPPERKRSRSRNRNRKPRDPAAEGDARAPADAKAKAEGEGAATRPPGARRKRARRRGRKPKQETESVLSEKVERVDLAQDREAPLSPEEISVLKEHFRFLQRYRRELRLKVNAAEDLLINGAREPTHRGICQHLLGKVDRASVLAACARLDPGGSAKLLSGVIRFSADIEYVLLLLETIKLTSSTADATATLSQGLQRIDFDRVSSAQMRRVLSLVVELFDERQRPLLLLGLLESPSFRDAFDKSIPDLPAELSQIVVPLRAAQAVILHGKRNTLDPAHLRAGVGLMLRADDRSLQRHSVDVSRRLLAFGAQACTGPGHALHRALRVLLERLPKPDKRHSDASILFARHLLAAHEDVEVAKLLKGLAELYPDFHLPRRWLQYLEAERIGRFALSPEDDTRADTLGHSRLRGAMWLDRMSPVFLQTAEPGSEEAFKAMAYLLAELDVAGLVPVLASGLSEAGEPYLVIPDCGPGLDRVLSHKDGLSLVDSIRVAQALTGILSALANAGVVLPDAALRRFSRDANGSSWLMDASGATSTSADQARDLHLTRAKEICREIFDGARSYIPPEELLESIEEVRHAGELMRRLAGSPFASPS